MFDAMKPIWKVMWMLILALVRNECVTQHQRYKGSGQYPKHVVTIISLAKSTMGKYS